MVVPWQQDKGFFHIAISFYKEKVIGKLLQSGNCVKINRRFTNGFELSFTLLLMIFLAFVQERHQQFP